MDIAELLQLMVKKNISDIHFKANSAPLIRVQGELISSGFNQFTSQHIEQLAHTLMTPPQRELFERDRELDFAYSLDTVSRFRVNVYRQRGTIALNLRVIPLGFKSFEELRLPVEVLNKLAGESRGLILFAGITGAGKTTSLNAMLNRINEQYSYNIITVEDPIEFYHTDKKSSISQREIGPDTHSYDKALHYVLRQDPDLIVIGEMREKEEMYAGITAAETGHLVLATIHTIDAVQTIDRFIDLAHPHQRDSIRTQLSHVIKGIIAQRLVVDKNTGMLLPTTEVLLGTSLVKKLIAEGNFSEMYQSMEQGSYYGMHTFDQDLHRLYTQDVIAMEEALDKASNPDDLTLRLRVGS